jgi:general secretion pathway protein D
LKSRIGFCALAVCVCFAASDRVAARLAKEARKAQNAGQLVRAYLLYAEAAARDPRNPSYAVNREALAPAANLLTKASVQTADIANDIKAAESQPADGESEKPLDVFSPLELESVNTLLPPPRLQPSTALHDFNLQLDEKTAFAQVATAYGVNTVFDAAFDSKPSVRFAIDRVDFRTAMEALTAVTNTFVFPISPRAIFIARDTELKRNEFEPTVVLTLPLPEAIDPKEILEGANAVRGTLGLRAISWDSVSRRIVIRDRETRAQVARSVLEALLLPRAQVSLEVQVLTVDSDTNYHYGVAIPTAFQIFNFSHIGAFQTILPTIPNPAQLFLFGGRSAFFGVTLTEATLFATYTRSFSRKIFDATVVVADGQTANLHVGDKYPIPQSIYTGFQQSGSSLYNPIGQVTLEDLGLVLKLSPRVNGDGDVSMEMEAEYKALGTQSFNTVPAIDQRAFKGSVRMREGEWAILAGMDENEHSISRNGVAGVSQIPGLNQILSENTRDKRVSNTLIVIKPTITRLPMSNTIAPQYLLGPRRGMRVML